MASKINPTAKPRKKTTSLREQIKLAKQELTNRFHNYRRILDAKENAILSELDAILISDNELHEKRRKLIESEGELDEKMKRNEFHDMKTKLLEAVSVKISEIENLVSDRERKVVELEWKESELLTAIQDSCVVTRRVKTINTPKNLKCVGKIGPGVGELSKPRSIAIDTENEDIYVADKDRHRVVVFDRKFKYIRNITSEGLKWPYAIVVISNFCFVSSSRSKGLILNLNKNTGELLAFLDPSVNMFALTYDMGTDMLLSCPVYTKSIWQIQPSSLVRVSEITLQTRYFLLNTTEIYDIKTHKDEIYVLFINSPYPLQSFSRDGNLHKTIIAQDIASKIQYFCIDTQDNLILSDSSADRIYVASLEGEILATICTYSNDGVKTLDIIDPRGVAIMQDGQVVFACGGKKRIDDDL